MIYIVRVSNVGSWPQAAAGDVRYLVAVRGEADIQGSGPNDE
jgi:hypothetical protein